MVLRDYNHQARQVVYKHVDSKHMDMVVVVVYKHVDSKHMDIVYKCDICHKLSPTQHALSEHVRSIHKQMQSPFWFHSSFFKVNHKLLI